MRDFATVSIVMVVCLGMGLARRHDHMPSDVDANRQQNITRRTACDPPTRSTVQFPPEIVGQCHITYDMNSGYVPVTDNGDYLFYWHFGPKLTPATDAGVIFWTNGGPGCSAMEGAISELGPLTLFQGKEKSKLYTGKLSDNPYSWNTYAHLVTVDQPRQVGYSFGPSKVRSSQDAAKDIVTFIKGWFRAYPEVPRNAKVYIAGESYGGHYVPAWGQAILDHNEASSDDDRINFAGMALGNACVDDNMQVDGPKFWEYLKVSNLVAPDTRITSNYQAWAATERYLGFRPNFYDFRLRSLRGCTACYDYDYSDWGAFLLQQNVQTALNVCPGSGDDAFGRQGGCISMRPFDSGVPNDYFKNAIGNVLDSHIPVVMYYGKTDLACDYVGGYSMAKSVRWYGTMDFNAAPLQDLTIAGASAAQVQQFGGLTWIQVESAGHMVPADQPPAAFFAINHLLRNASLSDVSAPPTSPVDDAKETCAPCPVCTETPTVAATASCAPCNASTDTPQDCPPQLPCPVCEECPPPVTCPTVAPTRASADMGVPVRCPEYPLMEGGATTESEGDTAKAERSKEIIAALATTTTLLCVALLVVLIRSRVSSSRTHAYMRAARDQHGDMYAHLNNSVGFEIGEDEDDVF